MRLDAPALMQLVSVYGYPALAVLVVLAAAGLPLPLPIAAIFVTLGALSAGAHGPNPIVLALLGIVSAAAGHTLDYWLGRTGSPLVQGWLRKLERRLGSPLLARVQTGAGWGSGLAILLTRFALTGFACPVSLLAGVARIAFPFYITLELVGEAIYFSGCVLLGRLLGPTFVKNGPAFALGWALFGLVLLAPALLARAGRNRLRRSRAGHAPSRPQRAPSTL